MIHALRAGGLMLLLVLAVMVGILADRSACTSPVTGEQALPWLEQMRSSYLAGCEAR